MNAGSVATIFLAGAVAFMVPLAALAEVSDKVLTIPQIWWWSVPGAVVAFVAWRYRYWCGFVVMLPAVSRSLAAVATVLDTHVGPAIRAEQGWPYIASAYGSFALVLTACIGGAFLRRARRTASLRGSTTQ
jgi:hypothetical protein